MKLQGQWDKIFRELNQENLGLWVSKVNPSNEKDKGGRSIYKDDKDEILKAAKKHSYVLKFESNTYVYFDKRTQNDIRTKE